MGKKTRITPEEAKKLEPMLKKLGLEIRVVYETNCDLCGKKFEGKDGEKLDKRLVKHLDEKCKVAKWMLGTTKILEIMGLKNVVFGDLLYIQDGKFSKGYSRTESRELEILNRVRDLFENFGKEEEE